MSKTLTRRRLLRHSLAALFSTLAVTRSSDSRAHEFPGYLKSKGVLVDMTRCIGCRSCEAACLRENGLASPLPEARVSGGHSESQDRQLRRPDAGHFTVVNEYRNTSAGYPVYRKIQCNHCQEPACLTACFVNAYSKTPDGAVVYNPEVCVGCRTCMIACPFSVPAFRYTSARHPRIMKCQFCYDTRLVRDLPPACVEACPMEALTFGRRSDLLRLARKRIRERPERYVNYIYGASEAGGTSWLYLSGIPFAEAGFDMEVPKEPILNYVKDFLAVVPMVLTIWPALFAGFHLLARRPINTRETEEAGNESPNPRP